MSGRRFVTLFFDDGTNLKLSYSSSARRW